MWVPRRILVEAECLSICKRTNRKRHFQWLAYHTISCVHFLIKFLEISVRSSLIFPLVTNPNKLTRVPSLVSQLDFLARKIPVKYHVFVTARRHFSFSVAPLYSTIDFSKQEYTYVWHIRFGIGFEVKLISYTSYFFRLCATLKNQHVR